MPGRMPHVQLRYTTPFGGRYSRHKDEDGNGKWWNRARIGVGMPFAGAGLRGASSHRWVAS